MKKIKMYLRILELLVGVGCIGFLIWEFIYFTLAPFYNGGYLPSLTYFGCGVNALVVLYLMCLEDSIREC